MTLVMQDTNKMGIVFTPSYVAELMANIVNIVNRKKVLDLCAGTGNLLSACKKIINNCEVLGIEKFQELKDIANEDVLKYIYIADSLTFVKNLLYENNLIDKFKPDALILNPPYQTQQKGMEFVEIGLDYLSYGDVGVVITQDSAGSGRAVHANKSILSKHRLIASIKMPNDLFLPSALVQTAIYVFQAKTPHNLDNQVKFIDFSNDGYKRSKRNNKPNNINKAEERYINLLLMFQHGFNATKHENWTDGIYDIHDVYLQDTISNSGADWNFNYHKSIDVKPTLEDFKKTVYDYMLWEWKNGKPLTINLTKEHIKNKSISLDITKFIGNGKK